MDGMSGARQDPLDGLRWRLQALPVKFGSAIAPGWMGRKAASATKLHLGCGSHILDGWSNLDIAGPSGVVRFDLNRPLPLTSSSVELVYSEHFIEHVTLSQGLQLLRECARVLVPGGVLRVSTPDLERLVHAYLEGQTDEWGDMGWRPSTSCDLLNEGMRSWGHQYLWDEHRLTNALQTSGFSDVRRLARHDSDVPDLRGLESRPDHGDLILEATRRSAT